MLKYIKIPALIILILCLNSCASNRAAFGPEIGVYELMLEPDAWTSIDSGSPQQLWLIYEAQDDMQHGIFLIVDYYPKSTIASLSAPDFDSFIKLYKTFGSVMEIYEGENNAVQDLLNIESKNMRGSSAAAGKRQQVFINAPQTTSITEYIFLESDEYYFAMYYGAKTETFAQAQEIINDVIKNLKVLK